MNLERKGWISRGKESAARFIDGRFINDQMERHELRTMTLLGVTGLIAAHIATVSPDPNVKFYAGMVAAANLTYVTFLTMEGWGRIGAYDARRNSELELRKNP